MNLEMTIDEMISQISDFCANVIPHTIDRAIKAKAENVELRPRLSA